jgi:hypothetical protein
MSENFNLINCHHDDAIEFENAMYRTGKLKEAIKTAFEGKVAEAVFESLKAQGVEIKVALSQDCRFYLYHQCFREGMNCEVLHLGAKNWQKGKFKINVSIEFAPDEVATTTSATIPQPELILAEVS